MMTERVAAWATATVFFCVTQPGSGQDAPTVTEPKHESRKRTDKLSVEEVPPKAIDYYFDDNRLRGHLLLAQDCKDGNFKTFGLDRISNARPGAVSAQAAVRPT